MSKAIQRMTRPRKIKTPRLKSGLIATDHSKSWDNRSNAGILWCWSGQSQNLGVGSMGLVGLWHGSMSPERLESLVGSWSYLNISSPWWLGAMLSMFCICSPYFTQAFAVQKWELWTQHSICWRTLFLVYKYLYTYIYIIAHGTHWFTTCLFLWVLSSHDSYHQLLHWFAAPEASSHTQTSTPTYPTKTSTYAILQLIFSRSFYSASESHTFISNTHLLLMLCRSELRRAGVDMPTPYGMEMGGETGSLQSNLGWCFINDYVKD